MFVLVLLRWFYRSAIIQCGSNGLAGRKIEIVKVTILDRVE